VLGGCDNIDSMYTETVVSPTVDAMGYSARSLLRVDSHIPTIGKNSVDYPDPIEVNELAHDFAEREDVVVAVLRKKLSQCTCQMPMSRHQAFDEFLGLSTLMN
jgi:hypothetical protein